VYNYTDALQGIIHGFKYRGFPRLAWHMGRTAARLLPRRVFAAADLVVPVPLHRLRRMQRGYNQAEMIARGMCVQAGIAQRFAAGVCIRRRRTRTQTHLSAHQRHTNCSGAFFVPERARARLQGARVLLVDDVVTTGATVRNCTYALQQAGCREVRVLCLARG
jgi:ComF family protein